MGNQQTPTWFKELQSYQTFVDKSRDRLAPVVGGTLVPPMLADMALMQRIMEIERLIMLGFLDSQIYDVSVLVRQGMFFPGAVLVCGAISDRARQVSDQVQKLQTELMALGLDDASIRLLSDMLAALQNKLRAESQTREKDLDRTPKFQMGTSTLAIDLDLYEKMVLGTDLQIQRKVIQEQKEFSDPDYVSLISLLDKFKRMSATRIASLSGVYGVTNDRSSLRAYYYNLMGTMIQRSEPSTGISVMLKTP